MNESAMSLYDPSTPPSSPSIGSTTPVMYEIYVRSLKINEDAKKIASNNDIPPKNPPQPGEVTPAGEIVCKGDFGCR